MKALGDSGIWLANYERKKEKSGYVRKTSVFRNISSYKSRPIKLESEI